jgi:hypothetical protein
MLKNTLDERLRFDEAGGDFPPSLDSDILNWRRPGRLVAAEASSRVTACRLPSGTGLDAMVAKSSSR